MIRKFQLVFLLLLLLLPVIVLAQRPGEIIPGNPGNILPGKGINDTLEGNILSIIKIFLQIVGLVAVAYIIYGGFRYVTSGGDEKAVETAKKTILNSLIGLVVVILSYVIVNVVINAAFFKVR
jgi:hypothetical protein